MKFGPHTQQINCNLIISNITNVVEFGTHKTTVPAAYDVVNVDTADKMLTDNVTCAICLEKINFVKNLHETECKHRYHIICIDRWLCSSSTCPVCRFVIL